MLLFIRREEEATRRECQRDETIDLERRQEGPESRCGVGIVFEVAEVSNSQDASWVPLADQDLMVSCLVPGSSAERCGVIQVCIPRNLHARPRSLMRDAPRRFFNLTNLSGRRQALQHQPDIDHIYAIGPGPRNHDHLSLMHIRILQN